MTEKGEYKRVVVPTDIKRYDRQIHRLNAITEELVKYVSEKDLHYGSSWRKRGGPGAFFVIARKWDRIEQACQTLKSSEYNIFDVFDKDDRIETILDDCLDLAGYLLILIEHMIEIGHVTKIDALRITFDDPASKVEASLTLKTSPPHVSGPYGFDEDLDSVPDKKE